MSAIWGIVPVSSTEKTEEALHTMRTSYAPFAIDRYSSLSLDTGVCFQCCFEFFSEEYFHVVFPFVNRLIILFPRRERLRAPPLGLSQVYALPSADSRE